MRILYYKHLLLYVQTEKYELARRVQSLDAKDLHATKMKWLKH